MRKPLLILAVLTIPLIQTFFSGCAEKTETKIVEVPVYTEVPVDSDDHLTISDVSWRCEEWLSSHSLTVTGNAKNTGTSFLNWIEIHVKGYDSSDKVVATGSSYIDGGIEYWGLSPGQSSTWTVSIFGVPVINKVTVGYSYEADVYIEPLSPKGMLMRRF